MEVAFIACKAKIKMIKNSVILKANWLSKSCCPQVISCCPCIAFRAMEFIIPGYAHSWHNCAYSVGYILFFLGVEMLDLQASPFLINFPCARTLRNSIGLVLAQLWNNMTFSQDYINYRGFTISLGHFCPNIPNQYPIGGSRAWDMRCLRLVQSLANVVYIVVIVLGCTPKAAIILVCNNLSNVKAK